MVTFSRRHFLVTAAATTAVTLISHGCGNSQQTSDVAQPTTLAETPEVMGAKLGFIALTDAAPLIIAKEKGLFAKYGMPDVEVIKQASWGVTRDNLVLGSAGGGIDGAHILTPMPYLMTVGTITGGKPVPMYILARLNTNGQGIVLANAYKDLNIRTDSSPLKEAFAKTRAERRAQNQQEQIKVAVTFPGGTHDLWMRYWLAAGGIDPEKDVSVIVVPPPQMVANVKTGTMEAFCVAEPWPQQAVNQKVGVDAITTGEFWQDHPEKSLTLRADWVDQHPKATKALLMAVMEAQQWCDQPENKPEMVKIIAQRQWLKVPEKNILDRSLGKFDFGNGRTFDNPDLAMKFWRDNASYPYQSHDLWFLTEDIRWGYLPPNMDTKALIQKVNREDLWREAAQAMGVPAAEIPTTTSRGVETFFDGVAFDPQNPQAYLSGLDLKKV
ncbi:CmpA/NrtA family ABC transporter substrate-binding protein [Thermosynechococcus sp. PP45]|uniref:CmpA/NrtA family ABC transporter substrate-binding protein n=1 Tax=unclassified Thermosynechococcus TaxID=2622553 RepID=UPI002670E82C|nr:MULTISPECIES: CmpA/NrtA family ABC transporter substrate-binding protein [unclassified Thermosynechococcus]MDR5638369.1 CmpA/NrtA family ABC transporter substrate-binding protein [Thermosynechococcus sp. PP42]MDR7921061.1 CmpA/NrtA family ABC transporter substrate-binding protein [Thermosynechococcus sp. HY213]WKT81689.1 CmpA/NrtA family ABC transporter substrate-binding protein [Thermosynechococcus sp. PP45]WNC25300.1 CmpA/NrtA family ABC transporter substrate-binding protein [Thermosynecho